MGYIGLKMATSYISSPVGGFGRMIGTLFFFGVEAENKI